MSKTTVLLALVLMFGLAIGAGAVAGKLSSRFSTTPPVERGTLSEELKLSPEQRVQMQAIWEAVQKTSRDCQADAQWFQREQDSALLGMLSDEQKKQYEQLNTQTNGKIAVLTKRRKLAFEDAVSKSKGILSESQRKTYEQIIQDRIGSVPDAGFEHP